MADRAFGCNAAQRLREGPQASVNRHPWEEQTHAIRQREATEVPGFLGSEIGRASCRERVYVLV